MRWIDLLLFPVGHPQGGLAVAAALLVRLVLITAYGGFVVAGRRISARRICRRRDRDDGALAVTKSADAVILTSPLIGVEIPALSRTFATNDTPPAAFPPPVRRIRGRHGL